MSRIDKLSVRGVRSFAPVSPETIQFFTPLTLIVGYNGSGKTTIIECLKYATTGELPPNSKGGAFLHDPKLAGEKEVLAQVKLKFSTSPATSHVVTRSLQLTVKKTTRTQKTLEGSLVTNYEGERSVASQKAVELDRLVPERLGVSSAILDAVIFCHQDESLWPLSEPAALKKRFDEIFEAMKYTKAIDNLKVLRKTQGEKLKQLKIQEGHEKVNKEKADRCEKRSAGLQDEIEQLRASCEDMRAQMVLAERQAKEKLEQANSFLGIVQALEHKQDMLDFRAGNVEELRVNIDELQGSDQWLQDTLEQYEARMQNYVEELEETKTRYSEVQAEHSESRRTLELRLAEKGKHQSDKENYERRLVSRVELVRQAASRHGLRGFDGDLDDEQVRAFNERISKLLAEKRRELGLLQGGNQEEIDQKSAVITELETRKAARTQDRVFAKQRIGALEKRINVIQNELNSLDVDEGAKAILDSSHQDLAEKLQKATQELQDADYDAQLQHENDHQFQLEAESSKLTNELVECTRLASDRAQLDLRKSELVEKRKVLATLTDTWSDKISSLITDSWKHDTIEREFQQVLRQKAEAVKTAEKKRDDTVHQLKQLQSSLASTRDKAKQRDEELDRCKQTVQKALKEVNPEDDAHIENLPKEIEDLEDDILTHEKDIALYSALKDYYLKCQKVLNSKNRCELCSRPFTDASEKSRLVKKIQEVLKDEEMKAKTSNDLALCEEQVGKLRLVRPQHETVIRLSSEKPAQDKEIQVLKERGESINRQLEDMDQVVRVKEEERQDLESLNKTVMRISQIQKEIVEAEAQVDRITSQQQSSGSVRSASEIQELQQTCNEQMRAAKSRLSKLAIDKNRAKDLINSLELERSRLSNKISSAVRQLEKKKDSQNQIQGLKDDLSHQRSIIAQADRDLESIEPQISKARTIRDDARARGRTKENKIADERDGLADSVQELKKMDGDIQGYLDRGGPSNLAANERTISTLNASITRLEKETNDVTASANKLKEEIGNSDRKKKNIHDNLVYRKSLREVETLRREIDELESRNAQEDYDRLKAEHTVHENTRHRLNAECGSVMGQMKSKDQELGQLIAEWETDYQDAAKAYREKHIMVETTKAVIEDLGRYGAALDKAIMQYHSLKMEEINRVAGELWRETYTGTDIDTIMIKSDAEGATAAAATGQRRSYNYRVVMVKQDTEMDMRGRCSAGQKVLASIIIRLALAESFGTNCGLIALDEPTTNLDSDNIRALARSLHLIIAQRRAQSNFQLIVITHDEEFLRHMNCSDFCDDYFRVARDERQNSVIERKPITDVA